jgi:hypothetical protein
MYNSNLYYCDYSFDDNVELIRKRRTNGTINVAGQNVASGDALRGSFTYVTA